MAEKNEDKQMSWEVRLEQAQKLSELGTECELCGGTGGWPGVAAFVYCKWCNGSGSSIPTSSQSQ